MAIALSLARADIIRQGDVVVAGAQVVVRKGTLRFSQKGSRGEYPGVTDIVQTDPSVWDVTLEDGDVLTVHRLQRRCGSCGPGR